MITPIILSGGNGTRLWPMSRKSKPKQFVEIIDGETMFTQTIKRFQDRSVFAEPIILGNIKHEKLINDELEKNNFNKSTVLLEPKAKNTAPAIGAVIEYLYKQNRGDEIVVFIASDAYIKNIHDFQSYLQEGEDLAKKDKIVCFGIKPIYPETGYGYIRLGEKIANDSYVVDSFVEKPNIEKAVEFLNTGKYLWNAGIFMSKVSTIRSLFLNLQKDLYQNIENVIKNSTEKANKIYLDVDSFEQCEEISIDYAILEKLHSDSLAVVSMNLVWSDLGSFKSLYDINTNKTGDRNIVSGHAILNNTENCFIKSCKKLICCSDVDDLIIVEEQDTILIMKKDKSQNIKKLIEQIKKSEFEEVL